MTRLLFAALTLLGLALVELAAAQPLQFQSPPPPAPGRSALPAGSIPAAELLAELRKGGYVIYFRHTSTDFSRDDAHSKGDDDCANQRPLNDRGREEARGIGAAFRELGIPVGKVLASPRCRTMETAMLAFGGADRAPEARGGPATPDNPDRYAGLRALLSTAPEPGTILVIASHGNPFYGVAGPPYLAEGEAAVIRPLGTDFEVIARIRVGDWAALAEKR